MQNKPTLTLLKPKRERNKTLRYLKWDHRMLAVILACLNISVNGLSIITVWSCCKISVSGTINQYQRNQSFHNRDILCMLDINNICFRCALGVLLEFACGSSPWAWSSSLCRWWGVKRDIDGVEFFEVLGVKRAQPANRGPAIATGLRRLHFARLRQVCVHGIATTLHISSSRD